MAARSSGNRLVLIKTVHWLAGYERPTNDYLVRQAKRGYRRCHTAAVGARLEKTSRSRRAVGRRSACCEVSARTGGRT